MTSEADRWKHDLTAAGWISESATACRAPDGSLWRGPYGAWKELQRRLAIEKQGAFESEYERLCRWRERWMRLSNKPDVGRLASRQERIEERVAIANNRIRLLMREFDRCADEPTKPLRTIHEAAREELLSTLGDLVERYGHDVVSGSLETVRPIRPNWNITTDEALLANWPIRDVLARLAEAATHLLNDHDCDAHGYESLQHAIVAAREYASRATPPIDAEVVNRAAREITDHFLMVETDELPRSAEIRDILTRNFCLGSRAAK